MLTFTRGYIAIKLGLGEPPWSIHAGFMLDFWLAFHWGTMSQSGGGLTWDESNHPTLSCLAAASSRERERYSYFRNKMEGAKELQWATDRVSQHDRYDRSLFYLFDLAFGGYTIISSQLESLTHLKDMASHGVSNHLLGAFKKTWCVFYDSYALAVLLVHWQGSLQPGLLGMTHKPRRSALWGRKMLALSAPPSPVSGSSSQVLRCGNQSQPSAVAGTPACLLGTCHLQMNSAQNPGDDSRGLYYLKQTFTLWNIIIQWGNPW